MKALVIAGASLVFAPLVVSQEQTGNEDSDCSPQNIEACDEKTLSKWRRWLTVAAPDQVDRRLRIDALPKEYLRP